MVTWSPGMTLEDVEEEVVKKAYDFFGKNSETTAKSLNISLNNFNKKMEKFKLKDQEIKDLIDKEKEKQREFNQRSRGIPPENSLNCNNVEMPISKKNPENRFPSNLKHKS